MNPKNSRAGAGGPGVTAYFSVLSSASAAALIALSAHRIRLGVEHPGRRRLPLDVDLVGPIGVLCLAKIIANFGKFYDVRFRGRRIFRSEPRRSRA